MAARAVIRDVGRVLDIPYAKVDGISKMVPNELNITIDKALKISKDLRNAYEQDEETHYLIDMSKRLEGLPRHASMHAAGVVIGKTAIDEYVPLATGADNAAVTQFTMTTIEELGLLKMDFFGTSYINSHSGRRENGAKKKCRILISRKLIRQTKKFMR